MILIVQDVLRLKLVLITNLIVLNEQASSPQDLTTPLFHTSLIVQDAQVACNILLPSLAAPADLTAPREKSVNLINLPDLPPPPHLLTSIVQVAPQEKYVHLTNLPALNVQASSLTVHLAHLLMLSLIVPVPLRLMSVSIVLPAPPSNLIGPQESNVLTTLLNVQPPLNSQVDPRGDRTNLREVATLLQALTDLLLLLVWPLLELSMMSRESQEILTASQLRSAWLEARFSKLRLTYIERG